MAKRIHVKSLFKEELAARASDRLQAAGDDWTAENMGFYFPENEDNTDFCALVVLRRALVEDKTTVPNSVREHVRQLINTDTVVDSAITIIFLSTFQPSPK